jgi:aspartate dehydrogenase
LIQKHWTVEIVDGTVSVGFIGYGTAARQIHQGIRDGLAGDARVVAALVRRADASLDSGILCTSDRARFLSEPLDLVVEVAGQQAVQEHAEAVLLAGKNLLVLSIGALADDALYERLCQAARTAKSRLLLPSGAIGALDAISSGALGGLDEVTLTTRKPPDALQTGTDRDRLLGGASSEPVLLYDGPARQAVVQYPANVNVAAALSLAGVGFDRTRVRIYADPGVTRNTHEVHVRGWFGELTFTIQNIPTSNPKTGRITALSALKAIRDLQAPVRLVG